MKMVTYTQTTQINFLKLGVVFAFIFAAFNTNAQCDGTESPTCNNGVQISLDAECSATVGPDLMLESPNDMCDYKVVITGHDDVMVAMSQYNDAGTPDDYSDDVFISHPTIGSSDVDSTYKVSVFLSPDPNGNSCWGSIIVEDKIPPQLECLDSMRASCNLGMSQDVLTSSSSDEEYCADEDTGAGVMDFDFTLSFGSGLNHWELVESLNISLNLADGACDVSDYTIDITAPDGSTGVATMVSGVFVTTDFDGLQTDEHVEGDWSLIITPTGGDCEITSVCLEIFSESFYTYDYPENCDNINVSILDDDFDMLDCREETEIFTAKRDITYIVSDNSGNADTCVFSIYYLKKTLDDIDFPDDITGPCEDFLGDYDINQNGSLEDSELAPSVTGVPQIEGEDLYPTPENNFCMFNISYSDENIESCGGTFKLIRTWTVYDWCAAEIRTQDQVIKSVDFEAPLIVCPVDQILEAGNAIAIAMNPHTCEGDLVVDPYGVLAVKNGTEIQFSFDCSGIEITVLYKEANDFGFPEPSEPFLNDGVIANSDGTFTIPDLSGPRVWIRYNIQDECGNVLTSDFGPEGEYDFGCAFEVDLIDSNPPTAVCDEFIAVTLGENGWARVNATSVDDGSHDCDSLSYQIRRVNGPVCNVDEFEAPGHNDLEFDDFTQFCCADLGADPGIMVEMQVTDPAGMTASCMTFVVVQDKHDPELVSCPADKPISCLDINNLTSSLTGEPVVTDNCGFTGPFFDETRSLDECNVGTIDLDWYVLDLSGTRFNVCEQELTVEKDLDLAGLIDYPADIIDPPLTSCIGTDTDPNSVTGEYPTYDGVNINQAGQCANITYTHTDQIFTSDAEACLKILRTWTVIDWCLYDSDNPSSGLYSHVQTIKVNLDKGPAITVCSPDQVEYCASASNGCRSQVEASITAIDGCTGELLTDEAYYSYQITAIPGGEDFGGNNASSSFNRNLPIGRYNIHWEVVDNCGNTQTCDREIEVIDCSTPSPYCIGKLTITLMPTTDEVQLWASDFVLKGDEYVYDDCDDDVAFSFTANPLDISETFNCDHVGENVINIFFTDDHGNQDFCTVELTIQANGDACDPDDGGGEFSKPMVAGSVKTESNEELAEVSVMLESMSDHNEDYLMTEDNGYFAFEELTSNEDYMLMPTKNDEHINGVSTLDIVLIQQHILGLNDLDSPYKLIAADVNNNEKITASDLLEIRQLILGINEEFTQNQSWRFVDAAHNFVDLSTPWPFTEQIIIDDITSDVMNQDFVAVKVGDVNNTATINSVSEEADTRNRDAFILKTVQNGNTISLIVDEKSSINGAQFTLDFNELVTINEVSSSMLAINQGNYSSHKSSEGLMSFSWNSSEAIDFEKGEEFIKITLADNKTLDQLSISSELTKAEAYNASLDLMDITLNNKDLAANLEVFQNRPNPFNSMTRISFDLPEDDLVRLVVMDVNGRIIQSSENWYKNGLNEVIVNMSQTNFEGVLYYELSTSKYSVTKKMIRIK